MVLVFSEKLLTGVQAGIETTFKTAVPATRVLSGVTGAPHREVLTNGAEPEFGGVFADYLSHPIRKRAGELKLAGHLTWDDLLFLASISLKGGVTPASNVSTFSPSISGGDLPDSATFEVGTPLQYYQIAGAIGTRLKLSGKTDDWVRYECDVMGEDHTEMTKTGSLSLPTAPVTVEANDTDFYLDAADGGTIGTTLLAVCVLDWTAEISLYDLFRCQGAAGNQIHEKVPAPTLSVTLAVSSAVLGLLETYHRTGARMLVRLANVPDSDHYLHWDMACIIKEYTPLGGSDQNGVETVTLTLEREFDPTYNRSFGFVVKIVP